MNLDDGETVASVAPVLSGDDDTAERSDRPPRPSPVQQARSRARIGRWSWNATVQTGRRTPARRCRVDRSQPWLRFASIWSQPLGIAWERGEQDDLPV